MRVFQKAEQVASFMRTSRNPLPLVLDMFRLKSKDYAAECQGLTFELNAGAFEWFTVLENVIREDYFSDGITLSKGDTVIDIGANFGSFCVVAAQRVGAEGRVVAFEPNPAIFERLVRNIKNNGLSHITAHNEAVSGTEGEIELFVHQRSAFSTVVGSVDRRSNTHARSVMIRCRAIASILESLPGGIDLLKIDCEGSEYDIIASLSAADAARIRQISMEVHTVEGRDEAEIGARLRELGFVVNEALPKLTALRTTCR